LARVPAAEVPAEGSGQVSEALHLGGEPAFLGGGSALLKIEAALLPLSGFEAEAEAGFEALPFCLQSLDFLDFPARPSQSAQAAINR